MLSRMLEKGQSFAYVSYLGDQAFSRQWTFYQGAAGDHGNSRSRHRLLFLSETDMARIGLGGPVQKVRAELICRENLSPISYRVTTRDSVNIAYFTDEVKLVLPDGTRKRLNPGPFHCVLGENVGQLALLLQLEAEDVRETYQSRFFSLGSASDFEYQLQFWKEEERGRWYRSNFEEELLIGPDGRLLEHASPKEGVRAVRQRLPLPGWMEAPILREPIQYRPPDKRTFSLEDVSISGPDREIGATLTVPQGQPPFPVLLFLGGTGSHDRHGIAGDIDLGTHEIMDGLAQRGWMGLRYDTPGAGGSPLGEDFLERGLEETITDAQAVLRFLTSHPRADGRRCALIGHSQGGIVAMEVIRGGFAAAAVCLLAAPGRGAQEVLADQIKVRGRWLGQSSEQVGQQLHDLEEFVRLVEEGDWDHEDIPTRFLIYKRQRKWYAEVLRRDPAALIAEMPCPVLICQGEKDLQVFAQKDTPRLVQAARAAGVFVQEESFPDLDHLFKPVEGQPHISQYYDPDRHVAPVLIERIHDFLAETLKTDAEGPR